MAVSQHSRCLRIQSHVILFPQALHDHYLIQEIHQPAIATEKYQGQRRNVNIFILEQKLLIFNIQNE